MFFMHVLQTFSMNSATLQILWWNQFFEEIAFHSICHSIVSRTKYTSNSYQSCTNTIRPFCHYCLITGSSLAAALCRRQGEHASPTKWVARPWPLLSAWNQPHDAGTTYTPNSHHIIIYL